MSLLERKLGYLPTHKTDGEYVILMETSGEQNESWYYFIRKNGNEENLTHLFNQLEKIDWYILDDLSTFDLDLEHTVSAKTAKEMTKVDLNHSSFHRKFDGVLQKIDFDFKKKDGNETKICKVFDVLGLGQIENFIDDEDLDEEDLASDSESNTDTETVSSEEGESVDDEESDEESDDESEEEEKKERTRDDLKKILREKLRR